MIEVQPDDPAVFLQRFRFMSAAEHARRGEPRQSALQLAGFFGFPFRESRAVGDDFMYPLATPDQDDDLFKG